MKCDKCHKDIHRGKAHAFAGYGFYVEFHPECCPREVDGYTCQEEHPEEKGESDES